MLIRLQPRNPPGHATRKARRYTNDIRKLRAEGYTYQDIRLALLDAGVSVSVSTVRREANRPLKHWELDHAQAEYVTSDASSPSGVAVESESIPQAIEPTTAAPSELASDNADPAIGDATRTRPGVHRLSGLFTVLRRFHRTGSVS